MKPEAAQASRATADTATTVDQNDPTPPTQESIICVLEEKDSIAARYDALVQLWTHRDATMHTWPPLIITATGALLALVFSQKNTQELHNIINPSQWGSFSHIEVWLGVGVPLLVGGLALMPFLYGMTRAIIIMDTMAAEIVRIETKYLGCGPQQTFRYLNHPGGWSSRWLIIRAMATISTLLTLAGSLFLLGPVWGALLFVGIVVLAATYLYSGHFMKPSMRKQTEVSANAVSTN